MKHYRPFCSIDNFNPTKAPIQKETAARLRPVEKHRASRGILLGLIAGLAFVPTAARTEDLVRACDLAAANPYDSDRPAGIPGVEIAQIDPKVALPACEAALAADPNNPRLLYEMGTTYHAMRDIIRARLYYEKAVVLGYAASQLNLAVLYSRGEGGLQKNYAEANRLYRLAADQGNATAQTNLGALLFNGQRGIAKDQVQAARLFKLAADQGDSTGQYMLGLMYEQGLGGIKRNDGEALRLFKLAADQGHDGAQYELALFYARGRGGLTTNDQEAVRLLKLSANQGNTQAKQTLDRLKDVKVAEDKADTGPKVAPSQAAQAAYDYLRENFVSNVIAKYSIRSTDNNVCHLRYTFDGLTDFYMKYDFDIADIQPESVRSVSAKEGNGWAGVVLNAASGKHFKTEGRLQILGNIAPTASTIKLATIAKPDDVIVRAFVRLAKECGAKPLPF